MTTPNDAPVRLTERPEVIYLEPGEGDPMTGPLWCEDDMWAGDEAYEEDGPSTKYVRADIADRALAEARELIRELLNHYERHYDTFHLRARDWLAVTAQEGNDD